MKKAKVNEKPIEDERANGGETSIESERISSATVKRGPLAILSDASLTLQKEEVALTVRLSHLARRGETCPDTQELLSRVKPVREWADERMSSYMVEHPAYWWFSHIKGIGNVNIAKVIGRIQHFGRFYDIGDPMIPSYVTREPEVYQALTEDDKIEIKTGVWVEGIERLATPSKLRVLAGHAPGMQRKAGHLSHSDAELKMLTWRVGNSLNMARGKFHEFYLEYKNHIISREEVKGTRIVPTPKGRYCFSCDKEVVRKAGKYCLVCGGELSQKKEPPGILYQGHLHQMAKRRMEQLFIDLLWVAWRKPLGLPLRTPYPVEYGGHSRIITPEDMMDK